MSKMGKMSNKFSIIAIVILVVAMLTSFASAQEITTGDDAQASADGYSHRLIVRLSSPAVAEWAASSANKASAFTSDGKLAVKAPAVLAYRQQLVAEQQAFAAALAQAIPNAQVGVFQNEAGAAEALAYQVVFNGVVVDAGRNVNLTKLEKQLRALPGVREVYRDVERTPDLYASIPIINAAAAWNNAAIGGMENAGAGVKVASMDGGVHYAAPMFDGAGYDYPAGYPVGYANNTNGKIIASRVYFRSWDPPAAGDENPWPGEQGTPHGVHTASTAAGNEVQADYLGNTQTISGVAPKAYVMSYRVFYQSVNGRGSFYNAEGIAALEDIVWDGADVVNNSWGAGPGSSGGMYDPLDLALINAWNAGVFVSMSAGNAGPGNGTTDHPSDYMNVAASSTDGTFASGRFNVTSPEPVPANLQGLSYAAASFGAALPLGTVIGPWDYLPSSVANPANATGCAAWPAGTFTGKAALIIRGGCEFGVKVLNAEQAGADFAVIYNSAAGGDALINMAPGSVGNQVTIGAIFIGHSNGNNIVSWYNTNGSGQFAVDTVAYQAGNTPDRIANFSSRGPGVGNVLKPDIAAPGVNILAQGYTPGATGEARHLGYGQSSGTSMAAPHVAGASALLKQIHPDWPNAWIKSALMSTAKYLDIYNYNETPAQPLDMGAGRLDLTNAANPGVILQPPSLSFGYVMSGTVSTLEVFVSSVADTTETYSINTLYTGAGFNNTSAVPGLTVTPETVTLAPGETAVVQVSWDSSMAMGYGDNQGYVVMQSQNFAAHMPAWIRLGYETPAADVLVVDNDGSTNRGYADYTGYYTATLDALSMTYDVWDADAFAGQATTIPDVAMLGRYANIIWQTGDNFRENPPSDLDMNRLTEYLNAGGHVLAFGQDLASTFSATTSPPFVFSDRFGAQYLQDSVNAENVYTDTAQLITGVPGLPFRNMSFDISARGDGAGNQVYMDEIDRGDLEDNEYLAETAFPILKYSEGGNNVHDGFVAISNRDQATLERPGTTFAGRALYFSFGLEGVNNDTGHNTREDLLGAALAWSNDAGEATITATVNAIGAVSFFTGAMTSTFGGDAVTYRWDFGDGTVTNATSSPYGGHTYMYPGEYTVRLETTNALGTRALAFYTFTLSGPVLNPYQVTLQDGLNGYSGTSDTYLNSWAPDMVHGADANLYVRQNVAKSALVRFDLASIPADAQITSARVGLWVTYVSDSVQNYAPLYLKAYEVFTPWAENEATWNSPMTGMNWEVPGANGLSDHSSMIAAEQMGYRRTGQWMWFDLPLYLVQTWVSYPQANKGVLVLADGQIAGEIEYISSEFNDAAVRPQMKLTYLAP